MMRTRFLAWTPILLVALAGAACGDEDAGQAPAVASSASQGGGTATATGPGGGQASSSASGTGGSGGGGGGGGSVTPPQNAFLYVANRNDDTVAAYAIDDEGALTLRDTETIAAAGPGPLAVNPTQTRLFVASVSGRAISTFDIDPASGELSAVGTAVSIAPRPVYIAVDPSGDHLLLASYGDNVAESYAIQADGTIASTPTSSLTGPGDNPHAIVLAPGGDFAFVPNTNPTPETISQFAFDATTGVLSANTTAATVDASGAIPIGPRHMTFHPTLHVAYAVNEHADSVTAYAFNPSSGTLTAGATTTTLTGGPSATNTCADIHITPDGSALYASNRGDDSLAMFSVDAAGALTPMGHVSTGAIPREFEITRDGRFVYAANQDDDTLSAFVVQGDGTLEAMTTPTIAVGDRPMWVLAVSVDAP